jgi:hypothetical protein
MSWYVNRGTLYLTGRDKNGHSIVRTWPTTGSPSLDRVSIRGNLVPNAPDIAVSPDGRWLLFAEQDLAESDLKFRKRQQ